MSLNKEQEDWLGKIKSDSEKLKKVPEELLTEELCLAAMESNGYALKYVPEALKTEAVCLAAVQHGSLALEFVPEELKTEAICFAAVKQDCDAIKYIPDALKTGAFEAMIRPVISWSSNLRYGIELISWKFMALSKEQVKWLEKISGNSENFREVPEELLTVEFCLAAMESNGYALIYVPEALKTEAVYLAAVQRYGGVLEYIPEALKTEALCLAAVQQNGDALKYVPEALKTEAICIEAMRHSRMSTSMYQGRTYIYTHPLQQVPEGLKTEAVCLAAVLSDYRALDFIPDALKNQVRYLAEVIRPTISSGSGVSGYGIGLIKPEDFKAVVEAALKSAFSTEALCLAAVQKNGIALKYVPEEFKTEALCLAAVQQNGSALEYVPEALKTEALCIEAMKHLPISSGSGGSGYGIGLIKPGEKG
jgi:hypothetical protein